MFDVRVVLFFFFCVFLSGKIYFWMCCCFRDREKL